MRLPALLDGGELLFERLGAGTVTFEPITGEYLVDGPSFVFLVRQHAIDELAEIDRVRSFIALSLLLDADHIFPVILILIHEMRV